MRTTLNIDDDLLRRAADLTGITEKTSLVHKGLEDYVMFSDLDDVFLSLEGVGQWVAVAWLSHPDGGGMDKDAAIKKMLGKRRWWAQDEGLALILALDRLMPDWPALEFSVPSPGATDLLARAVGQ